MTKTDSTAESSHISFLKKQLAQAESEIEKQKDDYLRTLNNLYKYQNETAEQYKERITYLENLVEQAAVKYQDLWNLHTKNSTSE